MPDFESANIVLGREYRYRGRTSTDEWHTRPLCASLPFVIVAIIDDIARDTGRSRSAVISDALLAHPAIKSGCISGVLRAHPDVAADLTARGIGVSSDVPQIDGDDLRDAIGLTNPTQGVDDAG